MLKLNPSAMHDAGPTNGTIFALDDCDIVATAGEGSPNHDNGRHVYALIVVISPGDLVSRIIQLRHPPTLASSAAPRGGCKLACVAGTVFVDKLQPSDEFHLAVRSQQLLPRAVGISDWKGHTYWLRRVNRNLRNPLTVSRGCAIVTDVL